ncbi:hypothetical protein BCR44DRAFT_1067347 [Catenaria anguillulae PL171]|uniref:Uncharacterized protein n=1 Tax=Catenaria anguillulae PL171 TaxID=765915 RepID=A0A1Y2HPJ8_9FUNG|nr:hypothetical protein BCR44DRAFT_1067347 [Catenaria anguillulae PL171]
MGPCMCLNRLLLPPPVISRRVYDCTVIQPNTRGNGNPVSFTAVSVWIVIALCVGRHAFAQSPPLRPIVRIMTAQPVSDATDWPATFASSRQWSIQSGIDIEFVFLPTAITNCASVN